MREFKTDDFKAGETLYLTACCQGDYTYWGDVMVCKRCECEWPRLQTVVCVPKNPQARNNPGPVSV